MMNNENMIKFAQIRSSYARKKIGILNNEEKALSDYETFCLELIKENDNLQDKIEYLKSKIENKDRWCQLIADIGYDYDGYRKAENLMTLIDELVKYALYSRDDYDFEKLGEDDV